MKLTLDVKELKEIKNVIKTVAEESNETTMIKDIKESIKNSNGLITYSIKGLSVEIKINDKYCLEMLKVYNKYLTILLPTVKALFMNYYAFTEETQDITSKYIDKQN